MAQNSQNTVTNDAQLLLTSIRLSNSASSTVVDDKDGIDGKINVTSDNRKYYIASFRDPSNPFGVERVRMFAQTTDSEGNPVWKSGNPTLIKSFVGKLVPGDIITRQVPPYMVGERMVDTFSCIVLKNESINSVFKQNDHILDGSSASTTVSLDDLDVDTETGEIVEKNTQDATDNV